MTWTLAQAEEHLLGLELFGMRFGLERMRRLLTALGSPQERFAAVHVVGTNGKGSRCDDRRAARGHGTPRGRLPLPDLTSFTERIRIGTRTSARAPAAAAVPRAAQRRPRSTARWPAGNA